LHGPIGDIAPKSGHEIGHMSAGVIAPNLPRFRERLCGPQRPVEIRLGVSC
jgi:hypothetical protein